MQRMNQNKQSCQPSRPQQHSRLTINLSAAQTSLIRAQSVNGFNPIHVLRWNFETKFNSLLSKLICYVLLCVRKHFAVFDERCVNMRFSKSSPREENILTDTSDIYCVFVSWQTVCRLWGKTHIHIIYIQSHTRPSHPNQERMSDFIGLVWGVAYASSYAVFFFAPLLV